jgi:metal-responsive CopG/Arc/MetJ family transcriptional regulator
MAKKMDSTQKTIYIPVSLLNEVREIAREEGTSVNSLIVKAVEEYVKRRRGEGVEQGGA